jgi:multiple sugar transport system permease protein/raffinose/stachyose/melibiose transport system permease protein
MKPEAGRSSWSRQRNRTYALFLAGPVLLFVVSYIYPVIYTFVISLRLWDGISPTSRFVGFANYATLFSQDRFFHAVFNNIRWLVFYLTVPTLLGFALALLVDGKLKGEGVFKVIFFIPYVITPVAVSAIWRWLYLPSGGLVNATLTAANLPFLTQNWLGNPGIVNFSVMAAALWWMVGFAFIIFLSGLRSIPVEYIEAARIDGASPWTIFWKIEVPLLWPSTILVVGLFGIDAMRVFDIVWSMTGGGPARASEVLATQLYDVAFGRFQMGLASAIGVCQLAIAAVLIFPYIIYIAGRVEDHGE